MGNIIIECPACQKAIRASTGPFAKKSIRCTCGFLLDVKLERMAEETCPHCGNNVVYDRKNKEGATCPVCRNKIHAASEQVEISCPSC
ncbi:MAG: hypothetical protein IJN34_06690, partial [Clostridia bacterium]|nr:hypothetical protein [Clostridia bacterium]